MRPAPLTVLAAACVAAAAALAPVARGAAETVGAWVTTSDLSSALARQPDSAFAPGTSSSALAVTVDPTARFQQMDGFGVSLTDSASSLIMGRLTDAKRTEVMAALFGPGGIGLSMLRQPMGSCDFNRQMYSYDDTAGDAALDKFSIAGDKDAIVPAIKLALAQNPDLRIIASPWSPPGWMKDSGSMIGGSLKPESYDVYAAYFVKFIEAYAAEGIGVYAVTPQNEPGYSPTRYPGCLYSAAQQTAFIRDHLAPALKASGFATKIICYDHNYDYWTVPQTILSDSGAAQVLAGSAFHHYGGDPSSMTTLHNLFPDKDIWFTEGGFGDWNLWFENMAHEFVAIPRNWAKSIILWNAALNEKDGPALIGDYNTNKGMVTIRSDSTDAVTYNLQYYCLGQLSKFVKPGAWRIGSTSWDGNVETVAFQNPDGSFALVAVNLKANAQSIAVNWSAETFSFTLPAKSMSTFTWSASAAPVSISAQPASLSAAAGGAAAFSVSATGTAPLSYQWRLDGSAIAGATASSYQVSAVRPSDAGTYTVAVTNPAGTVVSAGAVLTVTAPPATLPNRFADISTRCYVGTGSSVGVAGFILSQPSVVLVRAGGPSLANFGISNPLKKPLLTLFDSRSRAILSNAGWRNPPTYLNGTTVGPNGEYSTAYDLAKVSSDVSAYPYSTSDDSAIAVFLPAGLYTAQVEGADGGSGTAIVEVYLYHVPGDSSGGNRFAAISTRCFVGRGDSAAVVGLVVEATSRVLIRAVGPSLAPLGVDGVLPKPSMVLYDKTGTPVATNTGWQRDPVAATEIQAAAAAVKDFALTSSDDSAMVAVLPAGLYTARVQDRNGATGNAIVEAYLIPESSAN